MDLDRGKKRLGKIERREEERKRMERGKKPTEMDGEREKGEISRDSEG
jgi:hypothetical protein